MRTSMRHHFSYARPIMRTFIDRLLAVLLAFGPVPWAFPADVVGKSAVAESKILPATGEILPPFDLSWGAEARTVEEAVKAAGGRVSERQPWGPAEERWTVEGIAQEGLQRVLFSFSAGRLAGVELQYGKAGWDTKMYDDFMLTVRAELDGKHGEGRQLIRERKPDAGVLKTMLGYAWSGRTQSVALIYFSVQDQRNLFRLISLHYAGQPQRTAAPQRADAPRRTLPQVASRS